MAYRDGLLLLFGDDVLAQPGPAGLVAFGTDAHLLFRARHLLVIWTHNPDEDAEPFDELKESITGFLQREEGFSPRRGYLMDVFGPDGPLRHRLDARP